MREFNGLIKYQMQQYFSTSKFVMPFAVLMMLIVQYLFFKAGGSDGQPDSILCIFVFSHGVGWGHCLRYGGYGIGTDLDTESAEC